MSNKKLVRFEEVTPTLLPVAYFDGHLADLISHLKLPIYGGYNDLDEMNFAFLTLPSGNTVVVGEYSNAPRIGVDLYVDSKQVNISVVVHESCQQLGKSRNQVVWFSEKFQSEIDQLFMERGDIKEIEESAEIEIQKVIYDPIACFQHALQIYDQEEFPEYWAMLQYNLGTAYYDAFKSGDSDQGRNLKLAIDCYYQSLKIHTRDKFIERWKIEQKSLLEANILWFKNLEEGNIVEKNFDSIREELKLTGKVTDFLEFFISSIDVDTRCIDVSLLQQHSNPSFTDGFRVLLNTLLSIEFRWLKFENGNLFVVQQDNLYSWISGVLTDQAEYEKTRRDSITPNNSFELFSVGIPSLT
jgi:hypothetical protein